MFVIHVLYNIDYIYYLLLYFILIQIYEYNLFQAIWNYEIHFCMQTTKTWLEIAFRFLIKALKIIYCK